MLLAERLCKRFGERLVLQELDLRVSPGEIVGIIGANGVGKTTLFRVLCHLIRADSGTVAFGTGADKAGVPYADIGYLPESRSLFSEVTVGRTLEFWARLRGISGRHVTRIRDTWLEETGLLSRSSHRVSSLSKGNLQKLQLATCMLHGPSILILDEPFSGLDPVNQVAVAHLINRAAQQGAAVVLSAHHLELLQRISKRILVLRAGQLHTASASDLHPSRTLCSSQAQQSELPPYAPQQETLACE